MTGTTWDVQYAASAWPQLVRRTIAEAIQKNVDAVGMPQWTPEEQQRDRDFQKSAGKPAVGLHTGVTPLGGRPQAASPNDSGDVSWMVPAGSLNFPAAIPGIEAHEWHAAVFPTSSISYKGQLAGAKALAASLIDLLTTPDLLQKARADPGQARCEACLRRLQGVICRHPEGSYGPRHLRRLRSQGCPGRRSRSRCAERCDPAPGCRRSKRPVQVGGPTSNVPKRTLLRQSTRKSFDLALRMTGPEIGRKPIFIV
jgi:hypothetical protein